MSVCLSVTHIGSKSRTERPRKTKIGTEVAHVTRNSDTIFNVKRSRSQGWGHIVLSSRTTCYYYYCVCDCVYACVCTCVSLYILNYLCVVVVVVVVLGNNLYPGDHIPWRKSLDGSDSRIQHMLMASDAQLDQITTPFGTVNFVQVSVSFFSLFAPMNI